MPSHVMRLSFAPHLAESGRTAGPVSGIIASRKQSVPGVQAFSPDTLKIPHSDHIGGLQNAELHGKYTVMRLAIVENDTLMRVNLKALFSEVPGISVVGAYASSEEARRFLRGASPEVMIVDLELPGLSWLDLILHAKRELSGLDIMAHALFEETERLLSAIRAGASGYLMKGAGADAMINAVQGLRSGRATMSPKVAQSFLREFEKHGAYSPNALTGTQRTVVNLKAEGRTCREIANRSGLSLHDVGACFKSIFVKTQVKNWQ